jgi:hypothetical protein
MKQKEKEREKERLSLEGEENNEFKRKLRE